MRLGYLKELYDDHKVIKWSIMCLCILLMIALLLYLYYLVIAPIFSMYFQAPITCTGVQIYTQKEYLSFENGVAFQEYLDSFEFVAVGEAVGFYYRDNRKQDNPIYGKMCDIYAVDFQLEEQRYEACKEKFCIKDNYSGSYDAFTLYYTDMAVEEENITAIAFNDDKSIIRCIMVTDLEEGIQFSSDIITVLFRQATDLSFK